MWADVIVRACGNSLLIIYQVSSTSGCMGVGIKWLSDFDECYNFTREVHQNKKGTRILLK